VTTTVFDFLLNANVAPGSPDDARPANPGPVDLLQSGLYAWLYAWLYACSFDCLIWFLMPWNPEGCGADWQSAAEIPANNGTGAVPIRVTDAATGASSRPGAAIFVK
jgi:hypothetical protein